MRACLSLDEAKSCRSQLQISSADPGFCNRLPPWRYQSGAEAWGDWRGEMRNDVLGFLAAWLITWSPGAKCAASKMDCIFSSPIDLAFVDFFYCASSCNAKMASQALSLRCIRV